MFTYFLVDKTFAYLGKILNLDKSSIIRNRLCYVIKTTQVKSKVPRIYCINLDTFQHSKVN